MVFVTKNHQTISSITKIQGTNIKLRLNADSLQTRLEDENCPKLVEEKKKKRHDFFKRLTKKLISLFLWILSLKNWTRCCIKTNTHTDFRPNIEIRLHLLSWKSVFLISEMLHVKPFVCWINFVYAYDDCSKLKSLKK